MPETATPTPTPPQPARLPLTGSEHIDSVNAYVAKTLNALAGRLADGRDRFHIVPGLGVRYTESGLLLRVEKRYQGRGRSARFGNVDGVSPYKITVGADALNPPGATGATVPEINTKLHANGDAGWSKLHMAAMLHAQRRAEAVERVRLASARKIASWTKLAAYMQDAEAEALFPAPSRKGNLTPDYTGGVSTREWRWTLPEVKLRSGAALPLVVTMSLTVPNDGNPPDDWTPEATEVEVSVGFTRYESASHKLTLRDAFAMVRCWFAFGASLAAQVSPPVPERDRAACPACPSRNTVEQAVHVPGREVAVPADARVCRDCRTAFIGTTGEVLAAGAGDPGVTARAV